MENTKEGAFAGENLNQIGIGLLLPASLVEHA